MIAPSPSRSSSIISAILSESTLAKFYNVASPILDSEENAMTYPEHTHPASPIEPLPTSSPGLQIGTYIKTERNFWTSGYFPGSLWLLVEASRRLGNNDHDDDDGKAPPVSEEEWTLLARRWERGLEEQCSRIDTHDLGILISPTYGADARLTSSKSASKHVIEAAKSLGSRFNEKVGCLRSWDVVETCVYSYGPAELETDFLVIIDNMINLDLLFQGAHLNPDLSYLRDIAITHARTTARNHFRADSSTYHVLSYSPMTGKVQKRFAHQGYSDDSCWSRGQAWAIHGFSNTAAWMGREGMLEERDEFIHVAQRAGNYFLSQLDQDNGEVPPWDFNAPKPTFTDSSAATCAASGLITLHQLIGRQSPYLEAAMTLLEATLRDCSAPGEAEFIVDDKGNKAVKLGEGGWQTVLTGAVISYYQYAKRQWADHGLVYGDFYLLECAVKLQQLDVEL